MVPKTLELITAAVVAVVFVACFLVERAWPLRPSRESKLRRLFRNLTVGVAALAVAELLQTPFLTPVSRWTQRHDFGLLNAVPLPPIANIVATVLLMDYTLWWWHWLSHRWPPLWRFHLVHHVDLDLDASTGVRFHFGEHALSFVFRAAQIVAVGASPLAVWVWQLILFASVLFHHGNIRLPIAWERWIVLVLVTPRMHGIHHSNRRDETNSNWSSLFSWWDYLHGTILLSVPHRGIRIGVPAYQQQSDVTLGRILTLPFRRQREDWRTPEGELLVEARPENARRKLSP